MMTALEKNLTRPLIDLIAGLDQSCAVIDVSGLALDSRHVVRGDVFLACKGHLVDGRNFINQAIAAGAVAIVADRDECWPKNTERQGVPIIVVDNLSSQLSAIAGKFFQHPSAVVPVIAVTGTNGKTSCTQLMMQLLNRMHKSCAVMGTLGVSLDGAATTNSDANNLDAVINTTPDAVAVQANLAQWRDALVDAVAMEVSSHGIEQGRVAALQFSLALFTNLSRDHLDYHGSMQAYAQAKASLFQQAGLKKAVLNSDDDFSKTILAAMSDEVEVFSYSIQAASNSSVWVDTISYHREGVSAKLHSPWGQFELNSPLLGAFNLSNVVGVIAALGALGYPLPALMAEIPRLKTVPGRMQRIDADDLAVVVDYAHTPDALEQALKAMRVHTEGKLWCVFGCGGDRDQGKRAQMGEVAQRCADHVVVTSDNPRSESANTIIDDILVAVDSPTLVEEDRAIAIEQVIVRAAPGDSILVAGKGHEDYQQIGDQRLPFSDIKQARLALAKRTAVANSAALESGT